MEFKILVKFIYYISDGRRNLLIKWLQSECTPQLWGLMLNILGIHKSMPRSGKATSFVSKQEGTEESSS